jgi:LuxR family maltose regulon positive regulatory protein
MPAEEPPAMTVVYAAPGMGKSTLLAQWATTHPGDYSVIWISLSASSAGRFAFWRTVVDRVIDSGIAGPLSRLADIAPASPVSETLRGSLRRGFETIPGRLVLVLDDYHASRDSQVDDDLVWLVGQLPGLSIVIGARDVGSLTSPLTRSTIDVSVIDHDALIFSESETKELVTAAGLPPQLADDVYRTTAGWPMLVRARLFEFAETGRTDGVGGSGVSAAAARIAQGMVDAADPGMRRFILRTAVADPVPAALAVALTGSPESEVARHFEELASRSLGTLHPETGHDVFRYHPLLRGELEQMLQSHPEAEDIRSLRRDLASWYAENGNPLAGVQQAVLIEDWQLLDVIRSRYGSTLTMTHSASYLELLRTIPEDVLLQYPGLQLSKSLLAVRKDRRLPATIRQIGGVVASLVANRNARDTHQSELSRMWSKGVVMILHRLNGRSDAAARAAEEAASAVEALSIDDRDSAGSYVALAQSHIAITQLHLGNEPAALLHAQLDLEAAEHYSNEWEAVHAVALICWSLALQGDIVSASRWLERARSTTRPDGWQDSYVGTGYRLAEAIVALEHFDADLAEQHLRALDFHAPTIEHWPFMLQTEGMIALTRGATTEGARTIVAIAAMKRRSPLFGNLSQLVTGTRATLAIAAGDSAGAHAIDETGGPSALRSVAMARVALVEGHYERALMLSQLPADANPASPRLTAEAMLIKSLAAVKLGATSAGVEALRGADGIMRRFGMRQPLMLVPRRLLLDAVEAAGVDLDLDLDDVPDRFGVSRSVAALTRRERVVLNELMKTANLDAIARELTVSRNTIKGQLSSLYRKLGVTNRADALVVAIELGLVTA